MVFVYRVRDLADYEQDGVGSHIAGELDRVPQVLLGLLANGWIWIGKPHFPVIRVVDVMDGQVGPVDRSQHLLHVEPAGRHERHTVKADVSGHLEFVQNGPLALYHGPLDGVVDPPFRLLRGKQAALTYQASR